MTKESSCQKPLWVWITALKMNACYVLRSWAALAEEPVGMLFRKPGLISMSWWGIVG